MLYRETTAGFYEIRTKHKKTLFGQNVEFLNVETGGKGHAHNRSQGPKRVPGRLRPRIFLTFGTTRVVGRQHHAPAAFTPRGIPWYSFLEAKSTPGHTVPSVVTENFPSVTPPGIDLVTGGTDNKSWV
jgi:hypothetical protein